MNIFNYLKNIILHAKRKPNLNLLSAFSSNVYEHLINSEKIEAIINSIPHGLSKMEKAYYIYIELGKIVKEDPEFVFVDIPDKKELYNRDIDERFCGICKSISELYAYILCDKRIDIDADVVKRHVDSPISHVDVILKINGKNYIANLISDISRIKTSRKIGSFCYDLNRRENSPEVEEYNKIYLDILQRHYGKISFLEKQEIRKMDKKLGYSYCAPSSSGNNTQGIYTEDVLETLRKEFANPALFKKYILHGNDVPKSEILKYKLDFIFENVDKFTDFNGDTGYLENIRYYLRVMNSLLSSTELLRINAYVATVNKDTANVISIIKVKTLAENPDKKSRYLYYIYSQEAKKYISKTPEETSEFIDTLGKDKLNIIGTFDRFKPIDIANLDLDR